MITAGIHLIGTNTHHSFAWLRPSRRLEAQLELDPNRLDSTDYIHPDYHCVTADGCRRRS